MLRGGSWFRYAKYARSAYRRPFHPECDGDAVTAWILDNAQYNITYRNNVVWNCEYWFEYWNRLAESTTHDIYFEDNVCYSAGQGWSHAQRPWPAGVHLLFFSNSARTDRFFVRRNLFHGVQHSAFLVSPPQTPLRLGNHLCQLIQFVGTRVARLEDMNQTISCWSGSINRLHFAADQ